MEISCNMSIYIKAPFLLRDTTSLPTLFMAGGITGCEDWQTKLYEKIKDCNINIINPRRDDYNYNDVEEEYKQIAWEKHYLDIADYISFWFAEESVQPITFFELGNALGRKRNGNGMLKRIFVGCHHKFSKKLNLHAQLALEKMKYTHSLNELANNIKSVVNNDFSGMKTYEY